MLIKDPRVQLSITLFLIFLSAIFFYHKFDYLKLLVIAVGSVIFFDLIFVKLRRIELFAPISALTTGFIIALLISPTVSAYEVLIASFFAMLSKNFIRGSNRHIFNPAGFGLIFSSIIFKHPVSWWAVSFQSLISPVYFVVLLTPLLVSMIRLKRFMVTLPFLITYPIFLQMINNKSSIINNILDPTVLFFALVMLPEPMTSPNKTTRQILYAVLVALVSISLSHFLKITYDPLLLGLLTGNIILYRIK